MDEPLRTEFMSHERQMKLREEWEKENVFENPNKTHERKHPKVKSTTTLVTSSNLCTYNIERMKKGPPTVKTVIDAGTSWTDTDFTGTDTLYWTVGNTASSQSTFDTKLADTSANGLVFARWPTIYTSGKLF